MNKVLFAVFIPYILLASTIIDINFEKELNYLDIKIEFKEEYKGKINRLDYTDQSSIVITNANIRRELSRVFPNFFVNSLSVYNKKGDLYIDLIAPHNYSISAIKEHSRLLKVQIKRNTPISNTTTSTLLPKPPTPPKEPTSLKVWWFALPLLFGFYILYKRKRLKMRRTPPKEAQSGSKYIRFEEKLDKENKLMLISYKNREYLIVSNKNSNILLDTFENREFQETLPSEIEDELELYKSKLQ